jgi:transcriptional antiterminator
MNIQKIKHFIFLIQKERTGSPSEVSSKLGVSERMVYNYVAVLKNDFKVPLDYNRYKQTYFFSEDGSLVWEWESI